MYVLQNEYKNVLKKIYLHLLHKTGKYVSIDYVLVGTGCRIYIVYAFNLKSETIKERNRARYRYRAIICILKENS